VKVLKLADGFSGEEQQEYYTYDDLTTQYDEYTIVPLFVLGPDDSLEVVSEMSQFSLRPDDRLVALVGTGPDVRDQSPNPSDDGAAATDDPVFEVEETLAGDGDPRSAAEERS
jgi:hypothetical protein